MHEMEEAKDETKKVNTKAKERAKNEIQIAQERRERLIQLASEGSLEELQAFSPTVLRDTFDRHGSSLLHFAAGNGHLRVCKWLVQSNIITLMPTNKQFRTPLHFAARCGHNHVVEWFLDSGAEIDYLTKDGSSAFHWAAWQGQLDTCKLLLKHGANAHLVNHFGCNAAHWASMGKADLLMLSFLHSLGVEFTLRNHILHTPFHKAAWKGDLACCKWLVENIKGVAETMEDGDEGGRTPEQAAIMNGFPEVAEWIRLTASARNKEHKI
eukprot:TRINITY_DN3367_c0_g1_i1.p1 TRINITY_DN3367_c0_g1~~TRINITY_DN3367_c0_g1_i1.p1  ORF type:complete len:278 (-),score=45.73 TRINITY_DN3367_c0_g1_i1:217-1020(-)